MITMTTRMVEMLKVEVMILEVEPTRAVSAAEMTVARRGVISIAVMAGGHVL